MHALSSCNGLVKSFFFKFIQSPLDSLQHVHFSGPFQSQPMKDSVINITLDQYPLFQKESTIFSHFQGTWSK